jgi:hypothetical protein
MKYRYIPNESGLDGFSEQPNARGQPRYVQEETVLVYAKGEAVAQTLSLRRAFVTALVADIMSFFRKQPTVTINQRSGVQS